MKTNEREQKILEILRDRKFASVRFLAANLYTSPSSIRRSLTRMQSKGLVRRNYGGVILCDNDKKAALPDVRMEQHKDQKKAIAAKAADLLLPGMTVFLDASTTCAYMVEHIAKIPDITVFTNDLRTAAELAQLSVDTYCIGGHCLSNTASAVGGYAEAMIRDISADIFFFSSQALSSDGMISDPSAEETAIRKAMLANSKKRVFLCDSSKFGKTSIHRLCSLDDIEECFFDKDPE